MITKHSLVFTVLFIAIFFGAPLSLAENSSPEGILPSVPFPLNSSHSQGPDYELLLVDLPVSESTTSPGGVLQPTLVIRNTGSDSQTDSSVNITGYLDNSSLIPVSGKFPGLPAGQEKTISFSYLIPENTEYGRYIFSAVIDPDNLTSDTNISNNALKAGGIVSVTPPDDDAFIGCEACWEGYR